MGYAARAMKGLLVDCVRRTRAQKRGGGAREVTLPDDVAASGARGNMRERLHGELGG